MKEPGSGPMVVANLASSSAKNVPKRPPKAKYNLPETMTEETKYYSLPRRGKNGTAIRRSNSNCSLKSVDGSASTVKPQKSDGDKPNVSTYSGAGHLPR
jgi:hypothetical protein